jgi:DtxR family manganese transport transcriptional regulator
VPSRSVRFPSPRDAERSANGHRRTRSDHAREVTEDYVELVDQLIAKAGEARVVDVARHLGVTSVTVSKTIGRLVKEGLVTCAPYRSIFLTEKGKALAEHARSRHDTVLRFLMSLGVPRADAETDAEGIEHHLSGRTLDAMRRFLRQTP